MRLAYCGCPGRLSAGGVWERSAVLQSLRQLRAGRSDPAAAHERGFAAGASAAGAKPRCALRLGSLRQRDPRLDRGARRRVRVAVVHDWLVTYAGAERVLEQMLALYPEADLFSLIDFVPTAERGFLGGRKVHTSFLQRIPGMGRRYRSFLPLMPLAVEQFDLSSYDLVLSSSY